MGLLGLSACRHSKNIANDGDKGKEPKGFDHEIPAVMYGVPERDLSTTVISTESEKDTMVPDKTKHVDRVGGGCQGIFRTEGVFRRKDQHLLFRNAGQAVTDANGKPVKGLQVMMVDSRIDPEYLPDNEYWRGELARMSDTTDANGNFEVNGSDRPWEKIRVLVRDIDGAKNGSFQQQLVDVDFGDPERAGDKPISKWKLGTKTAEIAVKMKRKKK